MRRRDFIGSVGGLAAWPAASYGQQILPTVGFLYGGPREANLAIAAAVAQGLEDAGFVAGRNGTIEYRWSEGRPERVQELMAELIGRGAAVVVAGPTAVALAVKPLASKTPVVFIATDNP